MNDIEVLKEPKGYAEQLLIEEQSKATGIKNYLKDVEYQIKSKGLSKTDGGRLVVKQVILPVTKALEEWVSNAERAAGRRATALPLLKNLDLRVVAWFGVSIALDYVISNRSIQSCAIAIGRRMNDEIRFIAYEQQKPESFGLANKILDRSSNKGDTRTRSMLLLRSLKVNNVITPKWSMAERLHVGLVVLGVLIDNTGLFETIKSKGGKRNPITLKATDRLLKYLDQIKDRNALLSPVHLPMVCRPKPWTTPYDGGYYTQPMRLVKSYNPYYFQELQSREMPTVYASANAHQDTAFKIDTWVLEHLEKAVEIGLPIKDLPPKHDLPRPQAPIETEGPKYRSYKMACGRVYHTNKRNQSKRALIRRLLSIARDYKDRDEIYFPVQFDFRGRVYYKPATLNPQSTDAAKGLLTFAVGKPLGESGVRWLAIHIANTFGNDKVSLNDRAQWTYVNEKDILLYGSDPLTHTGWTKASKPVQFLAACRHWVMYRKRGSGYECSLPIRVDGTCSGIQHYAAMSLDAVAGSQVNLTCNDLPSDIYREVANLVLKMLEKDLSSTEAVIKKTKFGNVTYAIATIARAWINFGITRTETKRQVMVLPYGGTLTSCIEYTQAAVMERAAATGVEIPGGVHALVFSSYLATTIWEAMKRVVKGPTETMRWIRTIASLQAKQGIPMSWETPSGFPVVQQYPNVSRRRLKSKLGESVIFLTVREDKDGIDLRRSATASPPNIVHSCDGAALALTVEALVKMGVTSVVSNHDDYGTHACDMDTMSATLRSVFVRMYKDHDMLDQLYHRALAIDPTTPPPPLKGSLCLDDVLHSEYFFA